MRVVPAKRVSAKRRRGTRLGASPNVLNQDYFSKTWGGLKAAMVDLPLKYGIIRVKGGSAEIECRKRTKGDSNKVSRFIKKHFKLGARLNGTRMTAQRLVHHIIHHLPGKFSINP